MMTRRSILTSTTPVGQPSRSGVASCRRDGRPESGSARSGDLAEPEHGARRLQGRPTRDGGSRAVAPSNQVAAGSLFAPVQ
jgi:hypothetical protein